MGSLPGFIIYLYRELVHCFCGSCFLMPWWGTHVCALSASHPPLPHLSSVSGGGQRQRHHTLRSPVITESEPSILYSIPSKRPKSQTSSQKSQIQSLNWTGLILLSRGASTPTTHNSNSSLSITYKYSVMISSLSYVTRVFAERGKDKRKCPGWLSGRRTMPSSRMCMTCVITRWQSGLRTSRRWGKKLNPNS